MYSTCHASEWDYGLLRTCFLNLLPPLAVAFSNKLAACQIIFIGCFCHSCAKFCIISAKLTSANFQGLARKQKQRQVVLVAVSDWRETVLFFTR